MMRGLGLRFGMEFFDFNLLDRQRRFATDAFDCFLDDDDILSHSEIGNGDFRRGDE